MEELFDEVVDTNDVWTEDEEETWVEGSDEEVSYSEEEEDGIWSEDDEEDSISETHEDWVGNYDSEDCSSYALEDASEAEVNEVERMNYLREKSIRDEIQAEMDKGSIVGIEYQKVFTEDERISTVLNLRSDSFRLNMGVINLLDIAPTLPLKESRKQTYKGLTQSVKELGILTPIHVVYTEGYKSYLEEGGDPFAWTKEGYGDKYILLDGFRRVWAGLTNKMTECMAIIWDFDDMDLAMELLVPLSLMLNKVQRRDWQETWHLYQVLESASMMTPATLEYLLQLEPGDAMKLRDVMLGEYDDVKADLISRSKTLQQAYNALQKLRKEEDRLSLDDRRGLSEVEGSDPVVGDVTGGSGQLTYDEVKSLLEFDETDLNNISDEDFIELAGKAEDGVEIDRRKGEDIPRELKQAALARDNFSCQVSGYGLDTGVPLNIALGLLQVHHIIPLYLGGKNVLDNLVTLRMDIHTQLHIFERYGGKIPLTPEVFRELPEDFKRDIHGAMRFAKVIVDEAKRQGRSIMDRSIQEASRRASAFKMPGTDFKENASLLES